MSLQVDEALRLMCPEVVAVLRKMGTTQSLALAEYFEHATNIYWALDIHHTSIQATAKKHKRAAELRPPFDFLSIEQRLDMLARAKVYFAGVTGISDQTYKIIQVVQKHHQCTTQNDRMHRVG